MAGCGLGGYPCLRTKFSEVGQGGVGGEGQATEPPRLKQEIDSGVMCSHPKPFKTRVGAAAPAANISKFHKDAVALMNDIYDFQAPLDE